MLSGTLGDLQLKTAKQKYIESAKPLRMRLERVEGGRVLSSPAAASQGADGFFGDVRATEHEVKIEAMVSKLKEWFAAGGKASTSVRALVPVLRTELGYQGRNDDLREAARRYANKGVGMPVADENQ
jgi:hypothetical protein